MSTRPSAVNNDPGYFYNPKRLMILFTATTAVLMVGVLWMIWADFERPWKADQRAEMRWEANRLGVEETFLGMYTRAERDRIRKEVEQARAEMAQHEAELKTLRAQLEQAAGEEYAADSAFKTQKQYTAEADFAVQTAATAEEREARLARLERERDEELRLRDVLQLVSERRASIAARIQERERALEKARERERKHPALARLRLVEETRKRKKSFHPARNVPLLDFLAPPTKVEQVVLDNIVDNYEFATPKKVDRCATCHVGMTRPGFEPEKWPVEVLDAETPDREARFEEGVYRFVYSILDGVAPKVPANAQFPYEEGLLRELELHHATLDLLFEGYDRDEGTIALDPGTGRKKWKRYAKGPDGGWVESKDGRPIADYYLGALKSMRGHWRGHPYPASMVGSGSPHPYESFGCTVCHQGRGWSTDFGRAWHSPRRLEVNDWLTEERAKREHDEGKPHRHLPANRQWTLDEAMAMGHPGDPADVRVGYLPDEAQARAWEALGRGKKELEYWNYPQLPKLLVQSSCLKCHRQGVYATPEEEYAGVRLGKPVAGVPDTFEHSLHSAGSADPAPDRFLLPEGEKPYRPESLERGLDNFLRFGCYGCHKVDPAVYPFMEGQRPKVGPPLDAVASKTTESFFYKWIRNPKDFRPDTRMPRFWGLSNNSHNFRYRFADRGYDDVDGEAWANAEIYAVGRFILSESKGASGDEAIQLGDPARGERLVVGDYEASGTLAKACIACHDVPIRTPELRVDAARMREWVDPKTRRKYGWGDRMSRQHGPSLAGVGSKVKAKWLVEWLENPRGYWHDTNMPDLRLTREEALDVAAYLMTLRNEAFEKLPPVAADQGVLERMAQELKVAEQAFPTASQALAAVRAMTPEERTLYVGKKLVAHYGCFGCHQMESFKNATPVGTELTKWGSKVVERLEFNHVPIEHTRFDFAYAKLVNPRIYDLGMPRADLPFERLKMPRFGFTRDEARDLAVFLVGLVDDPVERAAFKPDAREKAILEGRKVVHRYNCQACHVIEGKGGDVWPAIAEKNAKWRPPDLVGQGMKTRPEWLFRFLKDPFVVRPFHSIRMPTFGLSDGEAEALVAYFAALSRAPYPFETPPSDSLTTPDGGEVPLPAPVELTVQDPDDRSRTMRITVRTEREMAKAMFTQYSCKSCHSTDPAVPIANRAPDFRHVRDGRLRNEWIRVWLWAPLKLQPGTAMPSFYQGGKPQDPQFFGGSAEAQIRALADYTSHHYTEKDR